MKELNIFVICVTINQLLKKNFVNIKGQFTRTWNTDACFAAMKLPKREILTNTKSLCMNESDTLAKFVAIKQLKSKLWPDTKNLSI